jgi:hypothetical protein
MNQTNSTPTAEDIEVWQALDEIDKDPCIGRLTKEEQNNLFDQFFSKEAKMERLERVRKRKQAATVELEKILAMEKQLLESLQE